MKWAKHLVRREKKLVRILRIMKTSKKYKKTNFGVIYKFGIKVPRTGDIRGARALDKECGNTL